MDRLQHSEKAWSNRPQKGDPAKRAKKTGQASGNWVNSHKNNLEPQITKGLRNYIAIQVKSEEELCKVCAQSGNQYLSLENK